MKRSRFPFVLLTVLASVLTPYAAAQAAGDKQFDLQAHRGGLGLTVESTLPAFAKALELGVSTLELDVQITEDRVAVVTHDRLVNGAKCRDTAPATAGDPEFPYAGKFVNTLTLAQVRILDCGSQRLPQHPGQELHPGEKMATLAEVFELVREHRAYGVTLNVETKVEASAPHETAPREQFVQEVVAEVRAARLLRQVTIQSFDWGTLMRMRQVEPRLPLVALTNYDFLQVDRPGASPWLGGIDIDDYDDDPIAAIKTFGATTFSPVHGFPQDGTIDQPSYRPYVTAELVEHAHANDILVVPWTVDDKPTMASLMDKGVDGIITDYPDRLRELMGDRGLKLPKAYKSRTSRAPLARAHAHNDYEHTRPLQDALANDFTSVEADVWLVDGELRVAHDLNQTMPGRTLESLYLQPLAQRVRENNGSVYRKWRGTFQLLIDVKSEATPTYRAVHHALAEYRKIMTTYRDGDKTKRAVDAVISGNRDLPLIQSQKLRYAGYDGRLPDLSGSLADEVMPLVSDNWTRHFTWQGVGPMPVNERQRLNQIVEQAHARGYRVRFWATPDVAGPAREAVWQELVAADVDQVNTDDLPGLRAFLRAHDPA